MKKLIYSFLPLLVVMSLFLSACSTNSSVSTPTETAVLDGATLLQERCGVCHPLSRVTNQRLSTEEWKSVVYSMVRRGAILTTEEEPVLIDYLVANFGP